ncbi:phosphate/phosphite/phosphonate ABC transporter substrate-binding protein [Brevibacterium album]|uniref:phosphate/phosphite/phosphonate ABC transporter substrate-binding protein n=1 Tax=Brevibacterium album TaxID=417948 RepID=UPI0003FA9912|nr:phosphate/phosphite/phosphonate ABC transporter substrate-binding protein [Brevibacterium album]
MSRTTRPLLAAGAAAALCLAGCSADDPAAADEITTLSFGTVPSDSADRTYELWSIFLELAEEELDVEIELFEATAAPAVIEAAVAGDLDLVFMGPLGSMLMLDRGAPVTTVGYASGSPQMPPMESVAVTRSDSGITDLGELAGLDVCFNNPSSTSGYLFPATGLSEHGIDPEEDINAIFVGDHRSVMNTVFEGECAAGFTFAQLAERTFAEDNDHVEQSDFTTLWRTETLESGVLMSTELPEEMQERITDFLFSINGDTVYEAQGCEVDSLLMDHPDGTQYCAVFGTFWGMAEADDSYWARAREVCEATDAPACQ